MSPALGAALLAVPVLVAAVSQYQAAGWCRRARAAYETTRRQAAELEWTHHDYCQELRSSGACLGLSRYEAPATARAAVPAAVPAAWVELEARRRRREEVV